MVIEAQSTSIIEVKTLKNEKEMDLTFEVLNAVIAPDQYANVDWHIEVE
jgi:hypothetical protein